MVKISLVSVVFCYFVVLRHDHTNSVLSLHQRGGNTTSPLFIKEFNQLMYTSKGALFFISPVVLNLLESKLNNNWIWHYLYLIHFIRTTEYLMIKEPMNKLSTSVNFDSFYLYRLCSMFHTRTDWSWEILPLPSLLLSFSLLWIIMYK